MSYGNLLTDLCDIYHLKELSSGDDNWGIPGDDMQKEYGYEDEADLTDVECYFIEKGQTIVQEEPNPYVMREYLIHFPIDVDVRVNDKIVWNGQEMKLQLPNKIKNHHIEVRAFRRENL